MREQINLTNAGNGGATVVSTNLRPGEGRPIQSKRKYRSGNETPNQKGKPTRGGKG